MIVRLSVIVKCFTRILQINENQLGEPCGIHEKADNLANSGQKFVITKEG